MRRNSKRKEEARNASGKRKQKMTHVAILPLACYSNNNICIAQLFSTWLFYFLLIIVILILETKISIETEVKQRV